MTAARQERKSRRFRAFSAAFLAVSALGGRLRARPRPAPPRPNGWWSTATPAWRSMASIRSPISSMPRRRPGRAELELRSAGAIWRFHNEGNRAAFAAAPGGLYAALRRLRSDGGGARRGDAGHPAALADRRAAALSLLQRRGARGLCSQIPRAPSRPPSGTGRRCSARSSR